MKVHFGPPNDIKTIANAISLYGDNEFESITRSTIPMLSLLHHGKRTFNKIIQNIGFNNECKCHLEYTVSPRHGRGKASHTDVMLIQDSQSLAIEAKWTESMYPTVSKWIKQGTNETNRRDVLKGWIELLSERVNQQLKPIDFENMIYQMVHRAASATVAGDHSAMAYFLFNMPTVKKGASTKQINEELEILWMSLGCPEYFPFYIVEIELAPTMVYDNLKLISKGKNKEFLAEAVSATLQGRKKLFEFSKKPRIKIVGES